MVTRAYRNRCFEALADEIGKVSPQKASGLREYGPDDYETAALEAMDRVYPRWWDRRGPWPLVFIVGAAFGWAAFKLFS